MIDQARPCYCLFKKTNDLETESHFRDVRVYRSKAKQIMVSNFSSLFVNFVVSFSRTSISDLRPKLCGTVNTILTYRKQQCGLEVLCTSCHRTVRNAHLDMRYSVSEA